MNMRALSAFLPFCMVASWSLASAQTFTLQVTPGSQSLSGSSAAFVVSVTPQSGFKASVVFRAYSPTLPAATFSMRRGVINPPYTETDTAVIQLTGPKSGGTHDIIIEGKNGMLVVRDTVSLTIPSKPAWQVYNTYNSPLPSDDIWSVTLDRNGHGWIATQFALLKFDGTNWTVFDTATGFPFAPLSTLHGIPWTMLKVAVDSSNNVWVTDGNELAKYDGTDWTLYEDSTRRSFFYDIEADTSGNIWIGNSRSVVKFDGADWTRYYPDFNKDANLSEISVDRNGVVWAIESDRRGLKTFDGQFWRYYAPTDLDYQHLNAIATDRAGSVWVATVHSLVRFDSASTTLFEGSNDSFPGAIVQSMDFDVSGDTWLGSRHGLGRYDGTNWDNYTIGNSGLPNDDIASVRVADDLAVWIATKGGGLAILDGTQSGYTIQTSSVADVQHQSTPFLTLSSNSIASGEHVRASIFTREGGRVLLYNAVGSRIAGAVPEYLMPGQQDVVVRTDGLIPGAYFLQVVTDNGSRTAPVLVY